MGDSNLWPGASVAVGDAERQPHLGWRRFIAIPTSRTWPVSPSLLAAALIGVALLTVIAATSWPEFGDEHAYWTAAQRLVAGQPLYDPSAPPQAPYAYWYPPVLAQVLAPFTTIAGDWLFTAIWTVLLVGCLWFLSGRNVFIALALVAFLPVALELRVRNVHLVIAALTVLALRRSWVFWIPATALKLGPALGVLYLLAAGRRREAILVLGFGAALAAISHLLAPGAWDAFLQMATGRAVTRDGGVLAMPYVVRLSAGSALAIAAGRRGGRAGEVILVVALTVANPTLWMNALSLLIAAVPLWRTTWAGEAEDAELEASAAAAAPTAPALNAAAPTPGYFASPVPALVPVPVDSGPDEVREARHRW